MANRYGSKAQSKVKRAMHKKKRGTLKSGRSGKTVTSRKQAIAIGLSEARKEGKKVTSRKQAIAIGLSEARRAGGKVPPRSSGRRRRTSAKKK